MNDMTWGWQEFSLILIGCFFAWLLLRGIKNMQHTDAFSSKSLSKSFYTMGVLAIVLISFIAFCIFALRL